MLGMLVPVIVLALAALSLVAFIRSARIGRLERRIAELESAVLHLLRERETGQAAAGAAIPSEPAPEQAEPKQRGAQARKILAALPAAGATRKWEEEIGRRWLGWVGVSVLLVGAGFALKFAFENRWIGDLGRVLLGLASGVGLALLGRWQLRLGRRGFAHTLTAGGVTLLYLSTYASYGFYRLIDPSAAFAFLAVIVVLAHLLAAAQNAWGIALMGQIGGFLVPVLLATEQDRYLILFSYILLLDAGAVLAVALRRWNWLSSVSFTLTHAMFWAWHADNYHTEKLGPAVGFLAATFALFAFADLVARPGRRLGLEYWTRLFANPFVFFAGTYALLEPEFPDWMGAFAVGMAALYAALAKREIPRRVAFALIGIAGFFATLAIPIQLDAHWVTLAWAVQASMLAWLAVRTGFVWFGWGSLPVFACALLHYLGDDAPWTFRKAFTPLLNPDFASAAALSACLLFGAFHFRRLRTGVATGLALCAAGIIWLASTLEAYSYFDVLFRDTPASQLAERDALRWAGQTWVSVIWAGYSAAFVAGGLLRKLSTIRWAGLALFGLTVAKVGLIDIDQLEGGYRVVALMVLGLLLLGAAWAYQRLAREERKS